MGTPLPEQLRGSPWTCSAVGSGRTAAPAGPLLEQVGEVRAGGPITKGPAELAGVPGSQPPRTPRPKLTSGKMGAKDLEPSEGKESRQEGSPQKAQGGQAASPQSHLSGNKGLLCRALLARLRPALEDQKLFPGMGAGAGHRASGTRRGSLAGPQGAARSPPP